MNDGAQQPVLSAPARAKIVALANQKGGVGKTTSVVNLAAAVAMRGFRTLLVDLDPQSNATSGLGQEKASIENSVYAVLMAQKAIADIVKKTEVENLDVAPAGIDLVGSELELAEVENRVYRLKSALDQVRDRYQFVFLDCPPSLGLITLNALTSADSVLIPIQCEYYALEGLSQLTRTVESVKASFNPQLELEGILFTMYDGRSNLTRQVREEVEKHFYQKTFRAWIPRNVRLAEAPGFGKPGVVYDPQSVGARAYKVLADEFLQNNNIRVSNPEPQMEPAEVR